MSEKIINGKKPLSAKPTKNLIMTDDVFGNPLALPPGLKKELEDQGLVGRWVNAKTLYANQGYHPKGWIPYKRKNSDIMDTKDFLTGNDPSGIVRRGDCVLATKTIEKSEEHKAILKHKADRHTRFNKEKANELKSIARESNLSVKVKEGYEDDEE